MEKIIFKKNNKKITPSRVALLGVMLGLLVALKYLFGFVPGIELVSFMFIIFGIILPIFDLALLVTCFNLLVLAIYGFGSWWIMYWFIFPIDAFVSKGLSKITKSKLIFGIWGFIAGFSVLFWYFISDIFFFDYSYAVLNIITALPVNLIEGITTMVMLITIGPILIKSIKITYPSFYKKELLFEFKNKINGFWGTIIIVIIVLTSIAAITCLFIYNDFFINLKQTLAESKLPNGELPT